MKKACKKMTMWMIIFGSCFSFLSLFHLCSAASSDRIRLSDVQVLTLHAGKYTTGRRSSPVPQVQCVGGSAKGEFYPKTVQCYNRGSDGNDIQWECKADMDNDYRFGSIDVNCEGYDYPHDPYVLKGSCGLEYTLDYTKQGHAKKHEHTDHDYGYGYQTREHHDHPGYTWSWSSKNNHHKHSSLANLIPLIIIGIIIYAVYRTCIAPVTGGRTGEPPPPYPDSSGPNFGGYGGSPPPPGFRPENDGQFGGCSGTGSGTRTHYQGSRNNNGPGFWTGLGAGGLLGYLFGGRNTGRNNDGDYSYRTGPSWGSGSGSGTTYRSSGSHTSTGTRTASGFGGTKRR